MYDDDSEEDEDDGYYENNGSFGGVEIINDNGEYDRDSFASMMSSITNSDGSNHSLEHWSDQIPESNDIGVTDAEQVHFPGQMVVHNIFSYSSSSSFFEDSSDTDTDNDNNIYGIAHQYEADQIYTEQLANETFGDENDSMDSEESDNSASVDTGHQNTNFIRIDYGNGFINSVSSESSETSTSNRYFEDSSNSDNSSFE